MKLRHTATRFGGSLALGLALSTGAFITSALPAAAQTAPNDQNATMPNQGSMQQGPMQNSEPLTGPLPETWNSAWDDGSFDRQHYVIGTVASFSAYRLLIARPDGVTTEIDLKKGTVIRPTGLNLSPGEHVAVVGYWSKGTFIANRVVLRQA